MKKILTAFIIIGLSCSWAMAEVSVGKAAPGFTVKDIQGKEHKLADFKGQIVVLEAYNLDCPFVANHYRNGAMQDLQGYVVSKGAVWLVVNSVHAKHPSYRSPEKARTEFTGQKMKASAWIDDHSGSLGKAYGLKTTPHMIVIDAKGAVAYQGAIDDQADADADPRKARNYVREAVDKLLADQPLAVSKTKSYGCGVKYAD
jgi:hypothetical protein